MNEELIQTDCRDADEIERALAQKRAADNKPLGRDITTKDIEDAIAELALRKAARSAADKIKTQDRIIEELRVRLDESRSNTISEEDREMIAETRAYAAQAAAKKRKQFDAESKGGKKGAATRKVERVQDPVKTKIERFVNDKMREWDREHPERKAKGYKGQYSNNAIFRKAENAEANKSANGKPIFTADQIKEWFKPSKRKRTGN